MIKIKVGKDNKGIPSLKLKLKDLEESEQRLLKRILFDSKEIKGQFQYETPLKYLVPIINLFNEKIKIDKQSKLAFYEFSDMHDDKYFYTYEITPAYMKRWRYEGCPNIFKTVIDVHDITISKEVIFKKINR